MAKRASELVADIAKCAAAEGKPRQKPSLRKAESQIAAIRGELAGIERDLRRGPCRTLMPENEDDLEGTGLETVLQALKHRYEAAVEDTAGCLRLLDRLSRRAGAIAAD